MNDRDVLGRHDGAWRWCLVRLGAAAVLSAVGILTPHGSYAATPAQPSSPVRYYRAPGSKAPFSLAVRVGDILYLSGQIGTTSDGKLPTDFGQQARQTMENVGAALRAAGSSFDDVFKCTAMLADMSRWQEFNQIYVTYFKPERLPARSAIGANGLALGAMVELECMAYSPG